MPKNSLCRELLWLLSEIEARFGRPGSSIFFRRLYLRAQAIRYGKYIWIGPGLRLLNLGRLSFGERCAIGDEVHIANHSSIEIGDDFLGASRLHIDSGSHDTLTLQPNNSPIRIGDRVWCGIGVTILAGVTIGNDVVIGAGSVVVDNIPPNSIAVGIPARVIKPLGRDSQFDLWTWAQPKKKRRLIVSLRRSLHG